MLNRKILQFNMPKNGSVRIFVILLLLSLSIISYMTLIFIEDRRTRERSTEFLTVIF